MPRRPGDFYYVGSVYKDGGGATLAGEWLGKALKGKGNLVYIRGVPACVTDRVRDKGFKVAMKNYPGIKTIFEQYGDFTIPSGMKVMEDALARFPQKGSIDAVFAHNDCMILGALQAATRAGRADEILFVGIDGDPANLEAIKAGTVAATGYQNTEGIHRWAAIRVAQLLYGQKIPKYTLVPWALVDKTNVDQFIGLAKRIADVEKFYVDSTPENTDAKQSL